MVAFRHCAGQQAEGVEGGGKEDAEWKEKGVAEDRMERRNNKDAEEQDKRTNEIEKIKAEEILGRDR